MRYLLTMLAAFALFPSFGQDTLYFNSGKRVLGRVVELDSSRSKIVYRQVTGETKVVLMSAIARIGFSDDNPADRNSTFPAAEIKELPPPMRSTPHFILSIPGNYTYGKLMVFANPFGIIKKQTGFPSNSTLAVGTEYLPAEHFGINGSYRFGWGYNSISGDTTTNTFVDHYGNETIYEISILPKIYPFGQKKLAWYIAPVLSFGKLWRYHYKSFTFYTISENTGQRDHPSEYKQLTEKSRATFSTYGGATGILFNVTRTVTISTQLLVISSNEEATYYTGYSNYLTNSLHVDYRNVTPYREFRTPVQFSLVYRFGGIKN